MSNERSYPIGVVCKFHEAFTLWCRAYNLNPNDTKSVVWVSSPQAANGHRFSAVYSIIPMDEGMLRTYDIAKAHIWLEASGPSVVSGHRQAVAFFRKAYQ